MEHVDRWLGAAFAGLGGVAGGVLSDYVLHAGGWFELLVIAAFAGTLGAIGTLIGQRLAHRRA